MLKNYFLKNLCYSKNESSPEACFFGKKCGRFCRGLGHLYVIQATFYFFNHEKEYRK